MTPREQQISGLLKDGLTYKEIERLTGYDAHNARKIAVRLGLAYTDEARKKAQLNHVRKTVHDIGAEYVSGYVNNKSVITIRLDCGHYAAVRWETVTEAKKWKRSLTCGECRRLSKLKKAKPPKLKVMSGEQMEFHLCPVCGTLVFGRGKYCSDECRNRAENKIREVRRREKIRKTKRDAGITVESLYRRDGGVCYLCGDKCDFDDYTKDGENFIAGGSYPSIDHVVPLSKGGTHTWDNVKLAHHRCNTIKGNKYPRRLEKSQ